MVDRGSVLQGLRDALRGVILGNPEAVELLLVGLLAQGHVLLEDVPGVGKTTLAKALAKSLELRFSRVQFTPDLLPTDILGSQLLDPKDGSLRFVAGPVFTEILLADEINRASPRTQSALLEAMNEGQVTVEGTTHPLPRPFFVLATQNPVDFAGTYPLPEAQLDRFLLRFGLGYPSAEEEARMLFAQQRQHPLDLVRPVASRDDLLALQAQVREVTVKPAVADYLVSVLRQSRNHPRVELGVSPRGALGVFRAAQARAFLQGRDYVSPDDVQTLAVPTMAHRLRLAPQARYKGESPSAIVQEIIEQVRVPV